jgi:hypothetical protein
MSKSEIAREFRYFVFKLKDVVKYLSQEQIKALAEIARTLEEGRAADGKDDFNCVVIEQDWPEYEEVWKSIEERHNNA